ncbi:hypothetical protein [Microbacterium natoriense]|uniref:VG15 protein n=1 Tax=Microbacterium natoriense TaxID=284570 RepID=UPI0031DE65A2
MESKAQLALLGDDAEDQVRWMLRRSSGAWESRRLQLLDTVPDVLAFYSEGSAALAADFYDDARVGTVGAFSATPVVLDRTVKIRRGVAWASFPLSTSDDELAAARFAQLMRSEMARPYRDTITTNRRNDPTAVGWKRITSSGACKFCRMLADKGAVYKEATAHFAAHDDCMCTCAPVFKGGEIGPEANTMQYMASKRRRSPKERAALKAWLDAAYLD